MHLVPQETTVCPGDNKLWGEEPNAGTSRKHNVQQGHVMAMGWSLAAQSREPHWRLSELVLWTLTLYEGIALNVCRVSQKMCTQCNS